eukprot:11965734-Ditylum_brightwellii.AAC.1
MTAGHHECALRRIVCVDSTSVRMWHSEIPFWRCADTPQNVMSCLRDWMWSWNSLLWKVSAQVKVWNSAKIFFDMLSMKIVTM